MSELYRIKFRTELFEVELEAADKDFISAQMMSLIEQSMRPAASPKLLQASRAAAADTAGDDDVVEDAMVEAELPASEEPAAKASEKPASEKPAAKAPEKPAKKRGRKPGTAKKAAAKKPAAKKTAAKKTAAPKKAAAEKDSPGAKTSAKPQAKATKAATGAKKKAPAKKKAAPAATPSDFDPAQVAKRVKASPHYGFIKEKILDKSNQINRILVSFYFAEELTNGKGFTTGDVASITEALGTALKSTNISSQLKKYQDLFIIEGERKRGSVVHYKLNPDGRKKLEDLLSSAS